MMMMMAAALKNNEWAAAGQRAHSLTADARRGGEDHGQVLCDGRRDDGTPGSPPDPAGFINLVGDVPQSHHRIMV